ncbi:hypothetical protein AMAG_06108 [Allomyces macrogynus ATCC 38327]|uniref:Uncharacterized protein n=1 Tax=Allomyces macrogynus (strain ATCC 38327) TaxID=578462 RepID=A0A0L0SE82_ALLM3|nr:hypothetical protein AMAG_06108 [Allomyces macrogynus ATCC 38327]|eukprot:KNE60747.1 hypothetical protein AMAG_06108 [Allomyces macrogynus ATCC 38327]
MIQTTTTAVPATRLQRTRRLHPIRPGARPPAVPQALYRACPLRASVRPCATLPGTQDSRYCKGGSSLRRTKSARVLTLTPSPPNSRPSTRGASLPTGVHELVAALAAAHAAGVLLGLSIGVVHAVETAALMAYAVAHVGHAAAAAVASAHFAHWARVVAAMWDAVDCLNEVIASVVGGGGGTVAPATEGNDGGEYEDEEEEDVDVVDGDEEQEAAEPGDE